MLAVGAWARLLDDTVAIEWPWMTGQNAQVDELLIFCYRIQMYCSLVSALSQPCDLLPSRLTSVAPSLTRVLLVDIQKALR